MNGFFLKRNSLLDFNWSLDLGLTKFSKNFKPKRDFCHVNLLLLSNENAAWNIHNSDAWIKIYVLARIKIGCKHREHKGNWGSGTAPSRSQWDILKTRIFDIPYFDFWVFAKANISLCKSNNAPMFFTLSYELNCSKYFHNFILYILQYFFYTYPTKKLKAKKNIAPLWIHSENKKNQKLIWSPFQSLFSVCCDIVFANLQDNGWYKDILNRIESGDGWILIQNTIRISRRVMF